MKVILFILLILGINSQLNKAMNIFNKCVKDQIGKPFVYYREGPDAFDIDGLIKYCSNQAKIKKTTINITQRIVPDEKVKPGDIWVRKISHYYFDGVRLEGKENKCICGSYGKKLEVRDCKTEEIKKGINTFFVSFDWALA